MSTNVYKFMQDHLIFVKHLTCQSSLTSTLSSGLTEDDSRYENRVIGRLGILFSSHLIKGIVN